MTRFRHSQPSPATTHCTIDTGDGTFQTAITFRSRESRVDVLTVARSYPKSAVSEHDHSSVSALFGGAV